MADADEAKCLSLEEDLGENKIMASDISVAVDTERTEVNISSNQRAQRAEDIPAVLEVSMNPVYDALVAETVMNELDREVEAVEADALPVPPSHEHNLKGSLDSEKPQNTYVDRESPCASIHSEEEERVVEIVCPRVNCTEKIIFCLDISTEMDKLIFRTRAGDKWSPMKLIKRALGIYVQSKSRIDKARRHQFALVLMKDTALWMSGFVSDPDELLSMLDDIQETSQCETFSLTTLFDVILSKVPMPQVDDPHLLPPPYIVRAIMIYGRSHCIPEFENREAQKMLQASPHFFFDALYIHEPPSEENHCEAIYDIICELDEKGLFYVFEVSRNPTKLYDSMAQLLAHPLQRPIQKEVSYRLKLNGSV